MQQTSQSENNLSEQLQEILSGIISTLDVYDVIDDGTNYSVINLKNNEVEVPVSLINENDIGDFKTFLKLSPPLRLEEDRKALVEGIKNGLIDVIVSDHTPEDEESKRLPFAQAATGAIGVETLLPLALELYHNESLPLNKIVECLTINPSNILKINKGTLKKGFDADICVIDLNKPWVVKAGNLKSKSKNTAIEDKRLQGKVLMTFLKGEPVFKI